MLMFLRFYMLTSVLKAFSKVYRLRFDIFGIHTPLPSPWHGCHTRYNPPPPQENACIQISVENLRLHGG